MRYLTNDLAKLLGVTTNTIRRYEQSGFLNPKRDISNYRWYESPDISKAAMVRLYSKCGFSHDEIRSMIKSDNVHDICAKKLEDMDKQLERLTRLRHWLKDNIKLMETVEKLKNDYTTMKCPAMYYITYSSGDKLFKENERLDTLKLFMYEAPEVQLLSVFKLDDIKSGRIISHTGWALKEIDVKKFGMSDIIYGNKFIEYYPAVECLYGAVEIPSEDIYSNVKMNRLFGEYLSDARKYIGERGCCISGDIFQIYVNTFGSTVNILIGIPFKAKA